MRPKTCKIRLPTFFSDQKKITKEQIEQKVALHVGRKFSDYIIKETFEEIRDEILELFTTEGNISGVSDQKDHEDWFKKQD